MSGFPPPGLAIDFTAPVSLALPMRFDGSGPRHFGAPPARTWPFTTAGFDGDVRRGASCNCATIELTPHCHGTHTESVAHLLEEPFDVCEQVPLGLMPAVILHVEAVESAATTEDSQPPPRPGDHLITRAAVRAAWPVALPFVPRALVLRTAGHAASPTVPPYLTRQCAEELVARGIEHLVIDLPSVDRTHDDGRLCAHRLFFGLAASGTRLAEATRSHCTITEYAAIPDTLADGPCALQLTLPRLSGDAVPSQPLVFGLVDA